MNENLERYKRLFDLSGRTALVTGGAGGIGSAICEGLAAQGCRVILTSRSAEKAEKVAQGIRESGGAAEGLVLEADSAETVKRFVGEVYQAHERIDILVNCIGGQIEAPAEDYTEEDWDAIFSGSLKAAFFISQAVARGQIGKNPGKHIHLTSVRSQLGIQRGYIGYCSSRGGMNMMIKQLATEWAKHGITVNGIAPTYTRTDLVARYLDDPSFYEPLLARIPLGRVAEPFDIAGLAMYLASGAADFVTGQVIFADGGVTACQ